MTKYPRYPKPRPVRQIPQLEDIAIGCYVVAAIVALYYYISILVVLH